MKKRFTIKHFSLIFTSILLTAGIMSGCGNEDRDTATRSDPSGSPRVKMTNSELENAIKAKLDSDMQIKSAGLSINPDADRNQATISGTVESQAMRTKAVELAKSASSGVTITDQIEVKPRELSRAEWTEDRARAERETAKGYGDTIGDSLDDTWIHTKIVAKLIGNATTPERKINVDVNNNIVTLRGTVDTAAEKTEAERVAKDTEGVKRVVNQLKVGASGSPTPKAKQ